MLIKNIHFSTKEIVVNSEYLYSDVETIYAKYCVYCKKECSERASFCGVCGGETSTNVPVMVKNLTGFNHEVVNFENYLEHSHEDVRVVRYKFHSHVNVCSENHLHGTVADNYCTVCGAGYKSYPQENAVAEGAYEVPAHNEFFTNAIRIGNKYLGGDSGVPTQHFYWEKAVENGNLYIALGSLTIPVYGFLRYDYTGCDCTGYDQKVFVGSSEEEVLAEAKAYFTERQ